MLLRMNGYKPVAPQMAGNGQHNPPENKAQGKSVSGEVKVGVASVKDVCRKLCR